MVLKPAPPDTLVSLNRFTATPLDGGVLLQWRSGREVSNLGYHVYRGDAEPPRSYVEYLTFVAFFPTLLAGPITRAETLLPQLRSPAAALDAERGGRALFLIALGFVKKAVIADYLAISLVDRVFELPGMYSSLEVLTGVYGYAVQIYCDFSGYSDIATGSALLLGIGLKDNFNSPYRSADLAEFWRRWHISLSTWLRDYLFFSLPGKRPGTVFPYLNLVITFTLGGLWHGAGWTFVIWGLLQGLGLAFMRFLQVRGPRGKRPPKPAWRTVMGIALTFHFVAASWIFSRAAGIPSGSARAKCRIPSPPRSKPASSSTARRSRGCCGAFSGFRRWLGLRLGMVVPLATGVSGNDDYQRACGRRETPLQGTDSFGLLPTIIPNAAAIAL